VQNLIVFSLLSKNVNIQTYRTIILPVVSYGCETWSLTLRGEHRLKVFERFERRVLRKIFGPKRYEVTGDWRRQHNEELHDLYSSPNTIRVMQIKKNKMGGACGTRGRGELHAGFQWGGT
jgi:hypothetical protein